MRASIEIECQRPELVAKALGPEIEKTKKFDVSVEPKKDRILLVIESGDISGLLAGIDSYATLIRTSINALEE